jgi:hypothetical protein
LLEALVPFSDFTLSGFTRLLGVAPATASAFRFADDMLVSVRNLRTAK